MKTQTTKSKRLKRLRKIQAAERDIVSAILTLRHHVPSTRSWVGETMNSFYYLRGLARKAP